MATSSVQGASVEGAKLNLKTRQFYPIPPKKDPLTKKARFGFRLGINGYAGIIEALGDSKSAVYETSMLLVGDAVEGESVQGWSLKPLGEPNISKGSGTHSAAYLTISGGCFASVVITPRHLLQDAKFMTANPVIVPRLRPPESEDSQPQAT